MAVQADVHVKNMIPGQITVTRIRPGGPEDTTIDNGSVEPFPALNPQESLIINVPEGKDMSEYPLGIRTSITDLKVSCSPNQWTVNIFANDLDPDVPTTVNITAGDPGE
jgi:hypothetical protein